MGTDDLGSAEIASNRDQIVQRRTPSAQTSADGSATSVWLPALYAAMTSGGAYHRLKLKGAASPARLAHPKSISVHAFLDGNQIEFAGGKQANACQTARTPTLVRQQVMCIVPRGPDLR